MLTIEPTGATLGATVLGLDARQPVQDREFGQILAALGQFGVLRFPDQCLEEAGIRRFSQLFGDIQGPSSGPRATTARKRRWPESSPTSRKTAKLRRIGASGVKETDHDLS